MFEIQDHYFKKAKKQNFLARSVFKLEEIDLKFKILKRGDHVVDFGYHPGSWTQYAAKKVGEKGSVHGIDIRPLQEKLTNQKNIKLFQKDIFDVSNLASLDCHEKFNVVLSDMAPNTTGIRSVDQDRSLLLVEKVFEILPVYLLPGGNFVIKVFDGHEAQVFLKSMKCRFKEFKHLRPKSTRSISKEFFVIGKGFLS